MVIINECLVCGCSLNYAPTSAATKYGLPIECCKFRYRLDGESDALYSVIHHDLDLPDMDKEHFIYYGDINQSVYIVGSGAYYRLPGLLLPSRFIELLPLL